MTELALGITILCAFTVGWLVGFITHGVLRGLDAQNEQHRTPRLRVVRGGKR